MLKRLPILELDIDGLNAIFMPKDPKEEDWIKLSHQFVNVIEDSSDFSTDLDSFLTNYDGMFDKASICKNILQFW